MPFELMPPLERKQRFIFRIMPPQSNGPIPCKVSPSLQAYSSTFDYVASNYLSRGARRSSAFYSVPLTFDFMRRFPLSLEMPQEEPSDEQVSACRHIS